jgi:hypothetical protein
VIPPEAFFYLHEIAICANRAASGCLLLAVDLPAISCLRQLRTPKCPGDGSPGSPTGNGGSP